MYNSTFNFFSKFENILTMSILYLETIFSKSHERAVMRRIVTRDREGGSQMSSVTKCVTMEGGRSKMAQICVM